MEKYFLKADWQQDWCEVTKEHFVVAERNAGFYPKKCFDQDDCATSGFSAHGMSGKVEYIKEEVNMLKNQKGFTLIELFIVGFIVFGIGLSIYGLVLCFKASIILGIIALIVEPSPLVIGVCALFGKDVAVAIQAWIKFPI